MCVIQGLGYFLISWVTSAQLFVAIFALVGLFDTANVAVLVMIADGVFGGEDPKLASPPDSMPVQTFGRRPSPKLARRLSAL